MVPRNTILTRSRAFPRTTTPRHTDQAGLCSGLGPEFRVGVVGAVSRESEKKCSPPRKKNILDLTSLVTKHYCCAYIPSYI